MKKLFKIVWLLIALFLGSCSTTRDFPVSDIIPAAKGELSVERDKNDNYQIKIEIANLADPKRLSPSKNYYIVWSELKDGSYINLGKLASGRRDKGNFKTVTAFKPSEIFITAEKRADIFHPEGPEVLRMKDLRVSGRF